MSEQLESPTPTGSDSGSSWSTMAKTKVEEDIPIGLQTLIERLRESELSTKRFMRLDKTKAAFEPGWQNDPSDVEDLKTYPRWGVAGREGLVLLDADTPEMADILFKILPETFTVLSPRRQLPHFYIHVIDGEVQNALLYSTETKGGSGEVRAQNHYLVAPGTSIEYEDLKTWEHKTGVYSIIKDRPIAKMTFDEFMVIIAPYLKGSSGTGDASQKITWDEMRSGVDAGERHAKGIKYATFLIGSLGLDMEEAMKHLREWNAKNRPPMRDSDLKRMVRKAIDYVTIDRLKNKEEIQNPIELDHLSEIEDPSLVSESVTVYGIISSNAVPYFIPKTVIPYWKEPNESGSAQEGRIVYGDPKLLSLRNPRILSLIQEKNWKNTFEGLFADAPLDKGTKFWVKDHYTLYLMRCRPPVFSLEYKDGEIVDEENRPYRHYPIYVVSDERLNLPAGALVKLTGTVMYEPSITKVALLVSNIEYPDEVNNYDKTKVKELGEIFKNLTVEERLEWILTNFEKYSRVVNRRNVAKAVLLTYFTPTRIIFQGRVIKGWGNMLIIGDTTTGKTETVRCAISLLKCGVLITGESASAVGLGGAATQTDNGNWIVDWGIFVLNNEGLVAVDGYHKLGKEEAGKLAESERDGKIKIAKAAKAEAPARTRQIKIANPLDPQGRMISSNLSDFLFYSKCIPTIMDKVIIARLDAAVFVSNDDVEIKQVTQYGNEEPAPELGALSEVSKMVWCKKIPFEFTPEAVKTILKNSEKLYKDFKTEEVPLVSIDISKKLAKMSCSAAALSLSLDPEYTKFTVTEEHVKWVVKFIKQEYINAGLLTMAKMNKYERYTKDDIDKLLNDIGLKIELLDPDRIKKILTHIAERGRSVGGVVSAMFDLDKKKQYPILMSELQLLDLVSLGRWGHYPTAKLNNLVRVMNEGDWAKEYADEDELEFFEEDEDTSDPPKMY